MERRSRLIIFYVFATVFILLGYSLVVFAFGYKYDFIKNKLIKTGSFQIKTNISADVYVNDRLVGRTSFLTNNFYLNRLLPRTYSVRVQSADHQSWQKNMDVSAGLVIEFSNVILLPSEFVEQPVASDSFNETKFLESSENEPIRSPDGNKNAWFTKHEIWLKWLNDSSYQPFKNAGETDLVTRFSLPVSWVNWYKDSNHLIAEVGGLLKFIEIDTRGGINIFDITSVDGSFYYDRADDAIFKLNSNQVVKISLTK